MFCDLVPVSKEYSLTGQCQQPTGNWTRNLGEKYALKPGQVSRLFFLATFEPWEVDEIACVRDFVMRRYAG